MVEEMKIEALETGRARMAGLIAVAQETQRRQRALDGLCAGHPAPFDGDGIDGESEPYDCNAGRRALAGCVGDQPVRWVDLVSKIFKRSPLQMIDGTVFSLQDSPVAPAE